jgi:hypothetical protein
MTNTFDVIGRFERTIDMFGKKYNIKYEFKYVFSLAFNQQVHFNS